MTLEEIQRAIEELSYEDRQELVSWVDVKDLEWDDEYDDRMKNMSDSEIVARWKTLQQKRNGHSQWLTDHSKAIAEIRELQRSTDERIEKLVSAIGMMVVP